MTCLPRRAARAGLAIAAAAAMAAAPSRATELDAITRAMASVYVTDVMSGRMTAYCEAQAPARGAAVRSAWQAWRQRFRVAELQRRFDAQRPRPWRESLGPEGDRLLEKLARQGPADAVCAELVKQWDQPFMDMRLQHAAAYGAAVLPAGAGDVVPELAHTPPSGARLGVAATNTVFTVPQLDLYFAQGSLAERKARLHRSFCVKGKVARRGDAARPLYVLEHDDPVYGAALSVSTGLNLEAHVGQEVIVSGALNELPGTVAVLRDAWLVGDTFGLKPSDLRSDHRLFRKAVPVGQRSDPAPHKR
jgi:hypothetical protein